MDLYQRMEQDRRRGKWIVGGLERCDYTKGLIQRMDIFEQMQGLLSEEGTGLRFYQVTAPSRFGNPDYQNLHHVLAEKVNAVNDDLGEAAVIHMDQGIAGPQNYRFMREVDIMMVTPLEDGMNLVAFEYILSQKYKSKQERGMLVLSTSGASRVLKERGFREEDGVVHVNALQAKAAAKKALAALKKGQHISDRLIQYVETERRVDQWARQNIDAILNSKRLDKRKRAMKT
ncbi:MAG: trehalose-6-phosphate synthase [Deltaproteobacteria bacterium]|nr:trehalose-6-phosphate synthase [Deltaproteobacteria bacterium]